ncbi:hypothetical protein BVC71_03905 [Marivivens niveibacter]|uniref:LysM domain-containing protein n=1 Tax=Marivivens niveibacter TaxID=1930667 RepID=A0A251X2X9_9RHOB|nr:hypothetical protein BVC71_03905 [Marivivens niveibacter]
MAGLAVLGVLIANPPAPTEDVVTEDAVTEVAEVEQAEEAAVQQSEPEPETVAPEETQRPAPQFDTVRIEPDGTAVIAGRFEGGGEVAILLDGDVIETVTAGPDGAFAGFFTLPDAADTRILTLLGAPDGDAVSAAETVIVSPTVTPSDDDTDVAMAEETDAPTEAETVIAQVEVDEQPAEMAAIEQTDTVQIDVVEQEQPEQATDLAAQITDDAAETVVETAEAVVDMVASAMDESDEPVVVETTPAPEVEVAEEAAEPQQPQILMANEDGIRVIQPADTAPEVMSVVSLDTISYDPAGDVALAGRATFPGSVQIYLDNSPVKSTPIAPTGDWSITLPNIETGVYTLRVDEIAEDGTVRSRIETPFKREEPEIVAESMETEVTEETRITSRTVQPGNTLWAIARETYGDGFLYVYVFDANRDDIRDPDLIYPGQVFVLPEIDG